MSVLIYTESASGKVKKASIEAVFYGSKIAAQLNMPGSRPTETSNR